MSFYLPYNPSVKNMTSEAVVQMIKMAPPAPPVEYQSFANWAQASEYSYEMAQLQANARYLRQLSMKNPVPPTSTPQEDCTDEPPQDFYRVRLAHNRDAIHALRRTRKMRHRHNLKFLATSFRLAHEPTTRARQAKLEKQVKSVVTESENMDETVKIAQQELAAKKKEAMTVEELKAIRAMKADKVKAAAGERLKVVNAKVKVHTVAERQDQILRETKRGLADKWEKKKQLLEATAKRKAEDRAEKRNAAAWAAGKTYRLY
ncbi:hypothetical protein Daus18300_012798 [Diaporthe australafricana]|uniref:Uncharacterized protein n=1 Tax=Diaporthe australafricana TaxID=127596 RepID=A0ABR3W217_9PEZI